MAFLDGAADNRKVEHPRLGEGELLDGPRMRPEPVLFGRRLADRVDGVDGNERDALATPGEGDDSASAADRRRPSAGAGYLRSLEGRLLVAWLRSELLPLPHPEWASFGAMAVILGFGTVFSSLFI
jgi:hypothetical protein